ncbi:MAG: sulfotransferase [Spongiibacter sp.]|nr:sulfotransferase [Spongiibacter sp.]
MDKKYLDEDDIITRNAQQAGLSDYLDPELEGRMRWAVSQFNNYGGIREIYYDDAVQQFKALVLNRLNIARDWAEHPGILDQTIEQPFFVIGNARAGTTFTQSVLALGDGCRTPDFRDVITPTPPPGSATYSRDAADQRAKAFVDYVLRRSPGLLQAHPYFDRLGDSEAEDEFLYSHDFNMIYPLHYLKVPSLPQPGIPADPDAALAFHCNMLKQLQWQRPTERWVGKGVLHQHLMPSLLKTYPDAICFWLHRPPEQYVASLFELLELQYGPFNDGSYKFDPQARLDSLKAGVERYMKLPEFHSSQVHHIPFRKMVADPINTLGGIFEEHGIPFSQAYQQRLKERMASPDFKGDRHGKYHYSLEKFGLTVEQVREMFTEYCAYFDL